MTDRVDVAVLGSGPAGLQAALTLARGQRRVVVVTGGARRNDRAHAIHNVITRDGVDPEAFRSAAWSDLDAYGVVPVVGAVVAIEGTEGDFVVRTAETSVRARRVILAFGVRDALPDWEGLDALWGPTVFQCPFCHGHELRGRRWGFFAATPEVAAHLPMYRAWTEDLVLFTGGWTPEPEHAADLAAHGVAVSTGAIGRLVAREDAPDRLAAVVAGGETVPCDALVCHPPQEAVALVDALGLARDEAGFVAVDGFGRTSVAGLSAAGDATTRMQSAVNAMATGQLAAAGICMALAQEDWARG